MKHDSWLNVLKHLNKHTFDQRDEKTMYNCEQMCDTHTHTEGKIPKWCLESPDRYVYLQHIDVFNRLQNVVYIRLHREEDKNQMSGVLILRIKCFAMRQIKIFARAHCCNDDSVCRSLCFSIFYHQHFSVWFHFSCAISILGMIFLWLSLQFYAVTVFRCVPKTDRELLLPESTSTQFRMDATANLYGTHTDCVWEFAIRPNFELLAPKMVKNTSYAVVRAQNTNFFDSFWKISIFCCCWIIQIWILIIICWWNGIKAKITPRMNQQVKFVFNLCIPWKRIS